MLKPWELWDQVNLEMAAASARLCVETARSAKIPACLAKQPPPRGCVLKHGAFGRERHCITAAASARLCVETRWAPFILTGEMAAASARLCVETSENVLMPKARLAVASARLCVETLIPY